MCPATTVVSNFGGLGHPLFTSEHAGVYSALWGIWVMSTGHLFGVSMGYYGKSLFVALVLREQGKLSTAQYLVTQKTALSGFLSALKKQALQNQWRQCAWSALLAKKPHTEQRHADQTYIARITWCGTSSDTLLKSAFILCCPFLPNGA